MLDKPTVKVKENVETSGTNTFSERIYNALGPLAGGIILDCMDLVTSGPFCLLLGPILGALAGWWITSIYQFPKKDRILWSAIAAIYCTIPFTGILPVATIISAISRFKGEPAT